MSKQELKLQKEIIDSLEALGGKGHKMASQFYGGVPDLLLKSPGLHAMIVEVKDFDEIKPGMSRNSGVTPLQRNFMQSIHDTGAPKSVALMIRGKVDKDTDILAIMAYDTRTVTWAHFSDPNFITPRVKGMSYKYDVHRLLLNWARMGVY